MKESHMLIATEAKKLFYRCLLSPRKDYKFRDNLAESFRVGDCITDSYRL